MTFRYQPCAATDCSRVVRHNPFCEVHMDRIARHGTTKLPSQADRVFNRLELVGSCWQWPGATNGNSYGVCANGQGVQVYRHAKKEASA